MVVCLPRDDLSGKSSSSVPQCHCFTANVCGIQILRLVRLQILPTVKMAGLRVQLCQREHFVFLSDEGCHQKR